MSEHHVTTQEAERSTAEAMQKNIASLADALGKPVPILPPAVIQQTATASSVDILTGKVQHSPCTALMRHSASNLSAEKSLKSRLGSSGLLSLAAGQELRLISCKSHEILQLLWSHSMAMCAHIPDRNGMDRKKMQLSVALLRMKRAASSTRAFLTYVQWCLVCCWATRMSARASQTRILQLKWLIRRSRLLHMPPRKMLQTMSLSHSQALQTWVGSVA